MKKLPIFLSHKDGMEQEIGVLMEALLLQLNKQKRIKIMKDLLEEVIKSYYPVGDYMFEFASRIVNAMDIVGQDE